MNDEQFEQELQFLSTLASPPLIEQIRDRDTAQREPLAQLQAEMPDLRANMTKALDLLQVLTSTKYTDRAFVEAVDDADEMLEQLRGKVVLEGLADQQEAQGAKPRGGRYCRSCGTHLCVKGVCTIYCPNKNCEKDRAALATQPATGEPVYQIEKRDMWEDVSEEQQARCKEFGYQVRTLWTAPPAAAHGASEEHRNQMADTIVSLRTEIAALRRNAAAHGDEAEQKLVLPERIDRRQYLGGRGDAVAQGWNDCLNWIDKSNAMRAQGDGEVQ